MNSRRSLPEIRCLSPVCPCPGGDYNSHHTEGEIKNLVKEADTQIYEIAIYEPVTPRSRTAEELAVSAPSVRGSLRHLADEVFRFQLVQQLAQLALIDPGVQPERPRLDDEARGPLLNWGQT